MATIIRADGTREVLDAPRTGLTLEQMQRAVGGFIEIVTVGGTWDRREILIVDEEGRLKGKPVNAYGTARYRGTPPRHAEVIVGDVIEAVLWNPGSEDDARPERIL
jgi:Domain of unknown function (DUF3846)